jgi:hypothetical protein
MDAFALTGADDIHRAHQAIAGGVRVGVEFEGEHRSVGTLISLTQSALMTLIYFDLLELRSEGRTAPIFAKHFVQFV